MNRKVFGPLSGGQITFLVALAILAPSAVFGAATFTSVALQDAKKKDYYASVDRSGRVATLSSPTLSTIATQGYFNNSGNLTITSPTTAQLAITQLKISETRQNSGINGADLTVRFAQYQATAEACTTTAVRYLTLTALQAGDQVDVLSSAAPLAVSPIGDAPYCLGIFSTVTNGATDVTNYYPYFTMTAYVERGKYTGIGSDGLAAGVLPMSKKAR